MPRAEGQYPRTGVIVIPAARPGGVGRAAAGETFVDRQDG
jgi:hypothetical protein